MKNIRQHLVQLLLGGAMYLLLWQLLAIITANHAIPTPLSTLPIFWSLKKTLLLHSGASFLRVLTALALALLIGIPLGVLLGLSQKTNKILAPFIYFLYPLPKVAFLPIFMLFWGLGNFSKVLLLFAIILLQVIISIRDGVHQIPTNFQKAMTNFQANFFQRVYYLILPALVPSLLTSLRVSIGIALASLFFAENYATEYGLGYLILSAWTKMDYQEMFAGIFCIALLGGILFLLLDLLEEHFHY
ncbi:NitT/TauT family transport system permease [Enterococcus sp. DIV0755b]|uniref:ABC transporter permease n=1 Tax=Enterococcus sp. DIV0755b TaxID=2774657 RepID=UPI003F250095